MWYSDALNFLVAKPQVASAVAAISSVFVAAAALLLSAISVFLSLAALKHQRTYSRLTVRPLGYVMLGDYEDHLFVKLRNNGTGPMIVKKIIVVGASNPSEPLINAMPSLPPKVSWTTFVEECEDRSVPAGGELVLVELSAESSASQGQFTLFRDKVRMALSPLTVQAEYTDIYGTSRPKVSRELAFFRRMLA